MIEHIQQWLEKAMPTMIFIFAIFVGMKIGFWAQSAIIIWAIVYYALRGEPNAERLQHQLLLLVMYAAIMAYASLSTRETLKQIEDICEENSREYDDQCSRILYEIKGDGRVRYDEPY